MKKSTGIALAAAAFSLASCLAGPKQLARSVDNYDQKLYIESPWIDGVLWFVPVMPLVYFGATIGDFFINGYHFWLEDAWDMKGTGFEYYQPVATDGAMRSLVFDDAELFQVK